MGVYHQQALLDEEIPQEEFPADEADDERDDSTDALTEDEWAGWVPDKTLQGLFPVYPETGELDPDDPAMTLLCPYLLAASEADIEEGGDSWRYVAQLFGEVCPELQGLRGQTDDGFAKASPFYRPLAFVCHKKHPYVCRYILYPERNLSKVGWLFGFGSMNDNIGSIFLFPYTIFSVCQHKNYNGTCRTFVSGASSMFTSFKDFGISSYRIWDNTQRDKNIPQWWYMARDGEYQEYYQARQDWKLFCWPRDSFWGTRLTQMQVRIIPKDMQGVAHNPKTRHWYFNTSDLLHKVHVSVNLNNPPDGSIIYVPRESGNGNHWGDPDYSEAYGLLIPNYFHGRPEKGAWLDVYEDPCTNCPPRYLTRYHLEGMGSVAYVAIKGDRFFVGEKALVVREYGLVDGSYSYDKITGEYTLRLIREYTLDKWSMGRVSGGYAIGRSWTQGAAFSPNGHFYYVFDYPGSKKSWSGVYGFDLVPLGSSSKVGIGVAKRFLPIDYDGDYDGTGGGRKWELQGMTIWDLDIVHGRHERVNHQVHVLKIKNTGLQQDDVNLYHIPVHPPIRL